MKNTEFKTRKNGKGKKIKKNKKGGGAKPVEV